MSGSAADLARRLARDAESVCRYYLSNGRRQGRYWTVGDVHNTPGRSLFVRLCGPDYGAGAAGKWTDAATGAHGDLLDLITLNRGLDRLSDTLAEARAFLTLPHRPSPSPDWAASAIAGSTAAARRLFCAGRPILGTPAERYLRARGITAALDWASLRFHPAVYYRAHDGASREVWPALLAAITDGQYRVTAVHRTWLDRARCDKAPLAEPRRSLGQQRGYGVRFGVAREFAAVGEGIETMLALKSVLPDLPMIAGLSATHLAALAFAPTLRRLYVARDNDLAGHRAVDRLRERGRAAGLDVQVLVPLLADFNVDLVRLGAPALWQNVRLQLVADDQARFAALDPAAVPTRDVTLRP